MPGHFFYDTLYTIMKRLLSLILILLLVCPLLPPARAEGGEGTPAPAEAAKALAGGSEATPDPEAATEEDCLEEEEDAPQEEGPVYDEPQEEPQPEEGTETEEDAAPDPAIHFLPEAGLPLPCEEYALTEKRPFSFGGTVESGLPLTKVSVAVSDMEGKILLQAEEQPDPAEETALRFPLWDKTFPFDDQSLSGRMNFASLRPGQYVFTLKAANEAAGEVTLYLSAFTVTRTSGTHTLIPNDLRGTYYTAEAYMGEGTQPLTYQNGTYGQIYVDAGWLNKNLTYIDTPYGAKWRVNKAAVEPFKAAIQYTRTTYIHVGGKYNSGVIRLSRLVGSYKGPYYGRQEENTPFISPHVLGLSVDINKGLGLNGAVPDNWGFLCKEISENLIYNGIQEKNGIKYYDFTYIGTWGTKYANVPAVIVNYLLYELAFYRAGFFWGAYYDHTCDASHFGLGEYDPEVHTNSPLALRKVFEYIDE